MRFLGSVLFLLWKWIENEDHAEVVALAHQLDNHTDGQLELEQFVAVPYGERFR